MIIESYTHSYAESYAEFYADFYAEFYAELFAESYPEFFTESFAQISITANHKYKRQYLQLPLVFDSSIKSCAWWFFPLKLSQIFL